MEAEKALYENSRLVGRSPEPSQPLLRVLNEHGEQIDKLNELFGILESRLAPVRNNMPQSDSSSEDHAIQAGSPILNRVVAQTASMQSLQRRISTLLEELDV